MHLNPSTTPYLTTNERAILKMLLCNGRMSDAESAKRLKITPQASNKIRKKLEKSKIIEGYNIEVDYPSIGINTFCIASLNILPGRTEKEILDSAYGKNIVSFYRTIKNGVSHFLIAGFPSLNELDSYFRELYSKYSDSIKIQKISAFPADRMIKNSSRGLSQEILKEFGKERGPAILKVFAEEPISQIKNKIKLNKNERRVLSELSLDSRISYKKIVATSEENKLTGKAVSNIKKRLERKGVIKGYSCNLNYKKFDIGILAILFLKKKSQSSEIESGLQKWAHESKHILSCYHLNEEAMHIVIGAFKDIKELENYSQGLHRLNNNLLDIEQIHIIPEEGILKDSQKDVISLALKN